MRITSLVKFLPFKWLPNRTNPEIKTLHSCGFPLQIKASAALWAEPMKPKKRIDPAILRAREEKKKRKVEKLIRKRLKLDRQLKPIEENEIPLCLAENLSERQRKVQVPENIHENRILLFKEWCKAKRKEWQSDIMLINRLIYSQQEALNELRSESEELYQAAVKIDEKFIPLAFNGPTETPQIQNYPTPDGEYIDISKKWDT